MLIGKLDRYVNIIQGTFSQNGYGENIRSTSTLASVWARFEFQRGDAGFEADTFIGTARLELQYVIVLTCKFPLNIIFLIIVKNGLFVLFKK